jgi:hypothetical protein
MIRSFSLKHIDGKFGNSSITKPIGMFRKNDEQNLVFFNPGFMVFRPIDEFIHIFGYDWFAFQPSSAYPIGTIVSFTRDK